MEYSYNLLILSGTWSAFEIIWTCGHLKVLPFFYDQISDYISSVFQGWNLPLKCKASAVNSQDLPMLVLF